MRGIDLQLKSTGIPGLDEILGGGIPRPSTLFIAGAPGTGRTTLGIQSLCHAASKGEKVLYVCPSPKTEKSIRRTLSGYGFYDDSINIRTYSISSVERDPLTMLVDLGNTVANMKPDRVMIDPVTPLGFGFPEAERRRFMYSLNTNIEEWNALVFMTGTMTPDELCRSVISDIVDGVIYLTQDIGKVYNDRRIKIIKFNSRNFMEGEHSFEINGSGAHVYPRLEHDLNDILNATHGHGQRIGTGIGDLDGMLGGGIFKRSSTLITGNTGTGKTLFGLHFIVNGALQGDVGIISSFGKTPNELYHYAENIGLDLRGLEANGLVRIIYTPPTMVNPSQHALKLRDLIGSTGAKRVLFDDISGFDIAFDNFTEKKEHLLSLIRYLKSKELTSMFISSNTHEAGDMFAASASLSSIVDNVLLLRHSEHEGSMERYLHILKWHASNHRKQAIHYSITDAGLQITDVCNGI